MVVTCCFFVDVLELQQRHLASKIRLSVVNEVFEQMSLHLFLKTQRNLMRKKSTNFILVVVPLVSQFRAARFKTEPAFAVSAVTRAGVSRLTSRLRALWLLLALGFGRPGTRALPR